MLLDFFARRSADVDIGAVDDDDDAFEAIDDESAVDDDDDEDEDDDDDDADAEDDDLGSGTIESIGTRALRHENGKLAGTSTSPDSSISTT